MSTHPLTRVTNWYVGHLQRNRREWIAAIICMFGFWDRAFGHWNLVLLALTVIGAKASRLPAMKRAAVQFVYWYLDRIDAIRRRRVIRRGAPGMIKRFPKNRSDLEQYLLARVSVRDQNGRFLYDLRIVAHPENNTSDFVDKGKLRVGVLTVNFADIANSQCEQAQLDLDSGYRVRIRVGDLDPHAFRVAEKFIVIDLTSGRMDIDEYAVNIRYRAAEPEHIGEIREAIDTIVEEPIRAAARDLLAGAGQGPDAVKALRKRFGRLLHPDRSSSASASNALASINAALDKVEA